MPIARQQLAPWPNGGEEGYEVRELGRVIRAISQPHEGVVTSSFLEDAILWFYAGRQLRPSLVADQVDWYLQVSQPFGLAVPAVVFVGGPVGLPLTPGEEYGWRGYLLPHLLPLGEIGATLIPAVIWMMWHIPILLIGLDYPEQQLISVLSVFMMTVTLMAFPFTWLYVQSL